MMQHLVLVALGKQHKQLLLTWRNDPFIVSRSSSARRVSEDEHDRWFETLLGSTKSLAYVIEVDGQPAGHLRMDQGADGAATLTAYLNEEYTGLGLGAKVIGMACDMVQSNWPGTRVRAVVRPENLPMQSALGKAGFVLADTVEGQLEFHWCGTEVNAAIRRFSARLVECGPTHGALDWGSAEGQRRRFDLLASIGICDGATVLDVGCGLGDLLSWLHQNSCDVQYTGLDVTQPLLDVAASRHPHAEFLLGNIVDTTVLAGRSFDYVVSSGLFYTYPSGGYAWMHAALNRMWAHATRGLAFNSLSTWTSDRAPGEFYADPSVVLNFCRHFSPCIELLHSYHPRDFTIHILRNIRS